MNKKKVAVILCGSGAMDGSEIHESVFALGGLDTYGAEYQCFALDEPQKRVMNFITKEELHESRNQMVEAARIARGNILSLDKLNAQNFDVLLFSGGTGVAYNLCTFATDGLNASVHPLVRECIIEFHSKKKVIAAICIAPSLLVLTLGTIGHRPLITAGECMNSTAQIYQDLKADVKLCSSTEYIHDERNNIYSTPAYMNNASISQIQQGIYKMLAAILL